MLEFASKASHCHIQRTGTIRFFTIEKFILSQFIDLNIKQAEAFQHTLSSRFLASTCYIYNYINNIYKSR